MYEQAKRQHTFNTRQRLKQWFAPHAWIPALLTLIAALLIALGVLPTQWSNWILVVLAALSFWTLFIDRRPSKTESEKLLEGMQKSMKQHQHKSSEVV